MPESRPVSFSMKDDAKLITEFLSWLDQQDGLDFTDNAAIARRFVTERNAKTGFEVVERQSH